MATLTPPAAVRFLCVDDNRDAADTEAALLRAYGCQAESCYDGPTALALADRHRFDACFLDLNMPGMDGDELAARLAERAAGRPPLLVCVTAQDGPAVTDRAGRGGFHLVMRKPVDPADLWTVARWAAEGAAARATRDLRAAGPSVDV